MIVYNSCLMAVWQEVVASVAVERALSLLQLALPLPSSPKDCSLRNSQLDELPCHECASTRGGRMYFPITALCGHE